MDSDALDQVIKSFEGTFSQIPPAFSGIIHPII